MLKRWVDLALSGLMLLLSLPVSLIIALAIRMDDGGPVFFRQRRWGLGGSTFEVLKFRTMRTRAGDDMALEGDSRITRVGGVLRAMGLDELPQLVNIMKGEMSFVGPRPLSIGENLPDGRRARYQEMPGFQTRLSVRPGLTSLATIYVPKDTKPRRKFRYDTLYVRKQSLGLDLKLIALSFWISFSGRWERRQSKLT